MKADLVICSSINRVSLFMVLAVSGPVRRLKPSRRIIFLENVPGVTVGGGGVSLIIVIQQGVVLHLMDKQV